VNELKIPEYSASQKRSIYKFIKVLLGESKNIEDARMKLLDDCAEKDEDGKPKTVQTLDENGKEIGQRYDISPDNMKKFVEDFRALMEEDFIMVVDASNEKSIEDVKSIVLNSKQRFDKNNTELKDVIPFMDLYENICLIFEHREEEVKE